ncbi:hypothetical protein IPL68_04595 [Candidatus Saccharibacteria bacterium]|nr:MAG: hypothetical protein IPL68_04595 [Candidatus Saccharibacteria bacterium]
MKEKNAQRALRFGMLTACSAMLCAGLLVYTHMQRTAHARNPLPKTSIAALAFTAYYPYPAPDGYSYTEESAQVSNGVLFYSLNHDSRKILVSQQLRPQKPYVG